MLCDQTQDAQARESVQTPSEPITLNILAHTVQSTTVIVPDHWSEKINSSNNGNGKALWAHLNCLLTLHLHTPQITSLITSQRRYDAFDIPHRATIGDRSAVVPLATFRPVSADKVAALIKKSPAKQCQLDPLPSTAGYSRTSVTPSRRSSL